MDIKKELKFWYFSWVPAKAHSTFRVGGRGDVTLGSGVGLVGSSKYAKRMSPFVTFSICCLDLFLHCFQHPFIMILQTTQKLLKSQHVERHVSGEAITSHNLTSAPCHMLRSPYNGCYVIGKVIQFIWYFSH